MASTPGFLTDFPWKNLGSYKYLILAPGVMQSLYIATKPENERDYTNLMIIPFLIGQVITCLAWTSVSRYYTGKGKNQIVHRNVEFEQVDRENTWDDQVLLIGVFFYVVSNVIPQASYLPLWRLDGAIITLLVHIGPLEYIYYWFHRALHHHYLYSRYHSHHHTFIATDPNDGLVHPFGENLIYLMMFGIPALVTVLTGTASLISLYGYLLIFNFVNLLGHCNFEFIPNWLFSVFPPLKYLIYTPSFHSLHHTQFRTNFSLFMPFYDWIHGTMDSKSDSLHEESLKRGEESADVVHLTHLTTPDSVFHLRVGIAYFASRPHNSKLWYMWPLSFIHMVLNFLFGRTFVMETNLLDKLKLQSWVVPRYSAQYSIKSQRKGINGLIGQAIMDADAKGVKVLSLGLLNQSEELNRNGELYIGSNPKLKVKVVDGSSLVVAIVINSIPKGTTEVLFRGRPSKVSYAIVSALCNKGIKVSTLYEHESIKLSEVSQSEVVLSNSYGEKVWMVGDDVTTEEQLKAPKGTLFIPFSQVIPKKVREHDCIYALTPSMEAPASLKNLHSCENWLPRRVMSASRVAGIVHALEGLGKHECGSSMLDIDTVWEACLKHGFRLSTVTI